MYPPSLGAVKLMFAQALVRSGQLAAAASLFDHMIRGSPDAALSLTLTHAQALLESVREVCHHFCKCIAERIPGVLRPPSPSSLHDFGPHFCASILSC